MNITGARNLSECEKVLKLFTRMWKLKKNLTMVLELMVSLDIHTLKFVLALPLYIYEVLLSF